MTEESKKASHTEQGGETVVGIARARRHLVVTTPWVFFFSAAYACTIYWAAGFLVESFASAATYYRLRGATLNAPFLLTYWLAGVFLPAWFVFSLYGYWLRLAPPGRALPRWLDLLVTAALVLMPWWWLMWAVRDPRLVLRNYRRRFLGEARYFMDRPPQTPPEARGTCSSREPPKR